MSTAAKVAIAIVVIDLILMGAIEIHYRRRRKREQVIHMLRLVEDYRR